MVAIPGLSLKEKVLLWLVWADESAEDLEGSIAPTQAGIQASTGLSRGHVSRTLSALVDEGILRVEPARVTGFSRVLKAYRVTEAGWVAYDRIRRSLLAAPVPVVEGTGDAPQPRILKEVLPAPVTPGVLWQALEQLETQGRIDPRTPRESASPARRARFEVDLDEAPPRPEPFVGRKRDLEWLQQWITGGSGVRVIEGPGGLGKTSLLLEAIAARPPGRHVLWVRLQEWSTRDRFLDRLAGFVARLGRQVPVPNDLDPDGLTDHLRRLLKGLPLLIVLDDVQKADNAVRDACAAFVRVANRLPTLRLCLVGRTVSIGEERIPGQDRLQLAPLQPQDAAHLLARRGVPRDDQDALVEAAGGVPLFLELLAERGATGAPPLGAHQRLIDDLGAGLTPVQHELMCRASANRIPFPAALLVSASDDPQVVTDLVTAGLLKRRDDGRHDMHDLVRAAFYERMSSDERRRIHAGLAAAYRPGMGRGTGEATADMTEYLHHLVAAGRRDEAVRWVLRNQSRILQHARRLFEAPVGRGEA